MAKTHIQDRSGEKGFTLVELAVVMIIIGILIGGILKGQELIASAQVQATVAQVKGIDAAFSTFRDAYSGLPGDINNVAVRIPNCENSCARDGNTNSRIDGEPGAAYSNVNNENGAAWSQMAAADLITGVSPDVLSSDPPVPGVAIPEAELGGGIQIGYEQDGDLVSMTGTSNARGGHYILIDQSGTDAASDATASMTPNQAERIDAKLDDGRPNTGSVRAMGNAGGASDACANGSDNDDIYFGANDGLNCGVYVRVQG